MLWQRRIWGGLVIALCLAILNPSLSVQAFGPYETLYVTPLALGEATNYEFGYAGDVQNHAFIFDVVAGDILTIEAHWIANENHRHDPWIYLVAGTPPVSVASVYSFDYEAADILPKVMRADERIEDWEVPSTGTYTLHVNFYPYEAGHYRLHFAQQHAAAEQPAGWMGEFTQLENGDYLTSGTLDGSQTWQTHSFVAEPGDVLTIMAWTHDDISADGTGLRLDLCQGGCDLDGTGALASDFSADGVAIMSYQVPNNVPAGTLYTTLLSGGANTGDYTIWMRQGSPDALVGQFAGGVSGELAQIEGGTYRMDGIISANTAFQVHSFLANPGDTVSVRVTAKRDTPADQLVPLVLLVPGGYVAGEQWLAMDSAEDTTARLSSVTIPGNMPTNMLYTVVVANSLNSGQLLFNTDAVFGNGGGYTVEVAVN